MTIDYTLKGGLFSELSENVLNVGVVTCAGVDSTSVASDTGQNEVPWRVVSALGQWLDVVHLKCGVVFVKEAKVAAWGDVGSRRSFAAVLANATVAFRNLISDSLRDVFLGACKHGLRLACVADGAQSAWCAPAQREYQTLIEAGI